MAMPAVGEQGLSAPMRGGFCPSQNSRRGPCTALILESQKNDQYPLEAKLWSFCYTTLSPKGEYPIPSPNHTPKI